MDSTSRTGLSGCIDLSTLSRQPLRRAARVLVSLVPLWALALPGMAEVGASPPALLARQAACDPLQAPGWVPTAAFLALGDERLWLVLMEEPSAYLRLTHECLLAQDYPTATGHLQRAGVYLRVAADSARQVDLQRAAEEVAAAAGRMAHWAAGDLEARQFLMPVFARAENALAAGHQARAADALAEGQAELAGRYLSASLQHLENASPWADQGTQEHAHAQVLRLTAERMLRALDTRAPTENAADWLRDEVARLEQPPGSAASPAGSAWIPAAEVPNSRLRF